MGADTWVIDDHGSVGRGDAAAAKAVVSVSDDDLAEIAKTGDVRHAFMHGKLRVDGDVRYAQRLTFFKGLVG